MFMNTVWTKASVNNLLNILWGRRSSSVFSLFFCCTRVVVSHTVDN